MQTSVPECHLTLTSSIVRSSAYYAYILNRLLQRWLKSSVLRSAIIAALDEEVPKARNDLQGFQDLHHLGGRRRYCIAKRSFTRSKSAYKTYGTLLKNLLDIDASPCPMAWESG